MFHLILNNGLVSSTKHGNKIPSRSLFYWLTLIFNRVDKERIAEVGPDRACAEWLLKNGAFVRWKGKPVYLNNYDALIAEKQNYFIEAVDATESGITYVGFPYFEGCKHIEEMKIVRCKYINDEAIPLLSILKDTLTNLELVDCKSVTEIGLSHLKNLKNLKRLKLGGMPYVQNKNLIKTELIEALPNAQIEF